MKEKWVNIFTPIQDSHPCLDRVDWDGAGAGRPASPGPGWRDRSRIHLRPLVSGHEGREPGLELPPGQVQLAEALGESLQLGQLELGRLQGELGREVERTGEVREEISQFVVVEEDPAQQEDGSQERGQDDHDNSLPVISFVEDYLGPEMWLTALTPVQAVVFNLIDDNDVDIFVGNTVGSPVVVRDADVAASSELLLRPTADPTGPILANT